jgi:hypothetical protein
VRLCIRRGGTGAAASGAPDAESVLVSTKTSYRFHRQLAGPDDVAYRDVRMLFDPADYASIGGEADLTRTIEGFKIEPFPYIATLPALPVSGAYNGDCLFTVTWDESGAIASAEANYMESMRILEELFPKDKAIFPHVRRRGLFGMMKIPADFSWLGRFKAF